MLAGFGWQSDQSSELQMLGDSFVTMGVFPGCDYIFFSQRSCCGICCHCSSWLARCPWKGLWGAVTFPWDLTVQATR